MKKCIKVHVRLKNIPDSIWKKESSLLCYDKGGKNACFNCFDNIIDKEDNQQVYQSYIRETISRFNEGYNVTIFAYGQTGSGKTHTILGGKEKGIVQLALIDVINSEIEMSFIEIFNEKIFDLATSKELKLFTKNDNTIVYGLSYKKVTTETEANLFIQQCNQNRKVGETKFNSKSSRSHAILKIRKGSSVLNFIDLAGSEKSCDNIKRMKEASFINKSLLALGKAVNGLLSNNVLGFRDSKLTRILQESITNGSIMLAFFMINPDPSCLQESLSTLSFAARLMNVDIRIKDEDLSTNERALGKNEINQEIQILEKKVHFLEDLVLKLLSEKQYNLPGCFQKDSREITKKILNEYSTDQGMPKADGNQFLEKVKELRKGQLKYEIYDTTDLIMSYLDKQHRFN